LTDIFCEGMATISPALEVSHMPFPVFPMSLTAQATTTPDGGALIGEVYFTPAETKELPILIGRPNDSVPSQFAIEYQPEDHAFVLRPFLDGPGASQTDHDLLAAHPEIPTNANDPRTQTLPDVYGKLREVVRRSIG
jgi:hypothetical protein